MNLIRPSPVRCPRDGIAIITINRPEQRNCLSQDVREGCAQLGSRFETGRCPVRVAILTGAGDKAFCAGSDLKEMVETGMLRCRRATCSPCSATTATSPSR